MSPYELSQEGSLADLLTEGADTISMAIRLARFEAFSEAAALFVPNATYDGDIVIGRIEELRSAAKPGREAIDRENAAFRAGWDDAIETVRAMLDERFAASGKRDR
jgi:hypothetical protein